MKGLLFLPVLLLSLLVGNTASSADAQKGLDAYFKGDYATTLLEWKPLAEHGDAGAQLNLGVMCKLGDGVPQNWWTAVKWFRLYAEQVDTQTNWVVCITTDKVSDFLLQVSGRTMYVHICGSTLPHHRGRDRGRRMRP